MLLMEGAMSYLLVPVFVRELSATRARCPGSCAPPRCRCSTLLVVLTGGSSSLAAPRRRSTSWRPASPSAQLAIDCLRIAASPVLFWGLGLPDGRAARHGRFLLPASTYVA